MLVGVFGVCICDGDDLGCIRGFFREDRVEDFFCKGGWLEGINFGDILEWILEEELCIELWGW